MDKKIVVIILIIIAVVIGGAYYTSHSDDNIMTIGYLPSDHDAALFVANSQGEFAKHGVHIKLVQFNNGGDLMTAMASGDVEVGYVGITPVLSSIEKGVPVKVISAAQSEGSAIVVSPNSGISSVSDLQGKKIATPGEASIQHMLLTYYLEQNGISAERKSVYSDIEALCEYGYDIIRSFTPKKGFFLASREFEEAEIYLLCDAVRTAKFISPKKTRELVSKLDSMLSFL